MQELLDKKIWLEAEVEQIIWTNSCFGLKGICRQQIKRKNWGSDLVN
jgi:hypothetical protein